MNERFHKTLLSKETWSDAGAAQKYFIKSIFKNDPESSTDGWVVVESSRCVGQLRLVEKFAHFGTVGQSRDDYVPIKRPTKILMRAFCYLTFLLVITARGTSVMGPRAQVPQKNKLALILFTLLIAAHQGLEPLKAAFGK